MAASPFSPRRDAGNRDAAPCVDLAGILFTGCWYMAELRQWPHILHGGRTDAFLLPLAFGLTVFVDLTWAISIGSLLAMIFFVKRIIEATPQKPVIEELP